MNPKMIESVNHPFIEPIIRTPVDNIKQLVDNMFNIISTSKTIIIVKLFLIVLKLIYAHCAYIMEYMTSPNMIEIANHALTYPHKRQPVNNILFCSGGGIEATFFTLGAIKQLLDNDKFFNTFDIITSASGSTITANIIELCYDNNLVGAVAGWYELYVVGTLYHFDDNYIVKLLYFGTLYHFSRSQHTVSQLR
jgi:hypothetical protein